MSPRERAIELLAFKRQQQLAAEQREWDEMQVRQCAERFAEQMRQRLADDGPVRGPWDGRISVPPGMVGRDWGLSELRIRCYARLLARRHVAFKRRWEAGW